MTVASTTAEFPSLVLHLGPLRQRISQREFFEFCQLNQDWRIERTARGDLVIMPPTGGETGRINFKLNGLFNAWSEADGTGIGFDSSTGFALPDGSRRSPDLSWVRRSRWESLSQTEQEEFPPLCPDFVVEIRSRSDTLSALQEKMEEYIANGAALGWLIDPIDRRVYIYRPESRVEILEDPEIISGDPLLRGFVLDLWRLWS